MTLDRITPLVLRLDAGANAALALAIATTAPSIAGAARLDATWPFAVLALLLAANAIACWGVAKHPVARGVAVRGLVALGAIDLVFAAVVGGLALADPTAIQGWLRWGAVGLADVVAVVGLAKLWLARRSQAFAQVV